MTNRSKNILLCSLLVIVRVSGQCSICNNTYESINSLLLVPDLDGATCADLDATFFDVNITDCEVLIEEASQNLDISSFCCSGQSPPATCNFCSTNMTIDPNFVLDADDNTKTCQYMSELAPYITNQAFCEELQYNIPLCCSDFEPSCGICIEGNMTKPEKMIPYVEETCELANRYFGLIQDDKKACDEERDYYNEEIDIMSYCGCSGHEEPPSTCSFCAVDKLIDPNFVVMTEIGALTCANLTDIAPFVTSETLCNEFQYLIPLCCSDFEPTCSLCELGDSMDNKEITIPGKLGQDLTCEVTNRYFGLIENDEAACDAFRDAFNEELDVEAYCGCFNHTPPAICDFCSMDDVIDENIVVGEGESARTCGYLSAIAPFISNPNLCEWLDYAAISCCNKEESCSICEGAEMLHPNRIVEYFENTTCAQLDEKLGEVQGSICDGVKHEFEINLSAYCGCVGTAMLSSCQFCDEDQRIKNHILPLPDRPQWACEVAGDTAIYIIDDDICKNKVHTEANLDFCCEPIPPTISPRPTDPFTEPPTQALPTGSPSQSPNQAPNNSNPESSSIAPKSKSNGAFIGIAVVIPALLGSFVIWYKIRNRGKESTFAWQNDGNMASEYETNPEEMATLT